MFRIVLSLLFSVLFWFGTRAAKQSESTYAINVPLAERIRRVRIRHGYILLMCALFGYLTVTSDSHSSRSNPGPAIILLVCWSSATLWRTRFRPQSFRPGARLTNAGMKRIRWRLTNDLNTRLQDDDVRLLWELHHYYMPKSSIRSATRRASRRSGSSIEVEAARTLDWLAPEDVALIVSAIENGDPPLDEGEWRPSETP